MKELLFNGKQTEFGKTKYFQMYNCHNKDQNFVSGQCGLTFLPKDVYVQRGGADHFVA